jgi:hypothetical protein
MMKEVPSKSPRRYLGISSIRRAEVENPKQIGSIELLASTNRTWKFFRNS